MPSVELLPAAIFVVLLAVAVGIMLFTGLQYQWQRLKTAQQNWQFTRSLSELKCDLCLEPQDWDQDICTVCGWSATHADTPELRERLAVLRTLQEAANAFEMRDRYLKAALQELDRPSTTAIATHHISMDVVHTSNAEAIEGVERALEHSFIRELVGSEKDPRQVVKHALPMLRSELRALVPDPVDP